MDKLVELDKLNDIFKDDMKIMIGGFLQCGTAETILDYLTELDLKNLTIVVNDSGFKDKSKGRFLAESSIKEMITSHIGTNPEVGKKMKNGQLEVKLIPQGTLIEQIRCKGAGLGGVLTPTGINTKAEEGNQIIEVDNRKYILATPIDADIAVIKAWKADRSGNLIYRYSARNFNPIMAMAADKVIVEAEEVVFNDELENNNIMTPNIFIDYIIESKLEKGKN